ncbi:hypothetical protein BJ912DRAFT_119239 [Pholiota molesta]|nr:hypothetical protein BJ912DRAFT_119239 [Pholiota molesta]
MTIPLSSDPLVMSPISRVPYDVLREIFIHCLPRYRLRVRQPNTEIAPMLLCHICSAWRTVALGSTTLWSHLSYCLAVTDSMSNPYSENHDWKFFKKELAFLEWWRRNQAAELEPDAVKTRSLFQYIASAQYLEAEEVFWSVLHEWNEVEGQDVYPNAHTLVKTNLVNFNFFYSVQTLSPNHTPSKLRHLSINHDFLFNLFIIPDNWFKLTRVTLNRVGLDLDSLLSFLRSVPDLQWAYFDIELSSGEHTQLPPCTLPHLSTFHIILRTIPGPPILEFPLRTVFAQLDLPALHTLFVDTSQASWFDRDAVPELSAVLRSAPAVTTLTLRSGFLSLDTPSPVLFSATGEAEPFWRSAPHLAHLRFQTVRGNVWDEAAVKDAQNTIVHNVFRRDNHWLRLDHPACPIQKITLIDSDIIKLIGRAWPAVDWGHGIKDYVIARFQEHAKEAQNRNIVFDIIHDTDTQPAAGAWNEWGPNLNRSWV